MREREEGREDWRDCREAHVGGRWLLLQNERNEPQMITDACLCALNAQ